MKLPLKFDYSAESMYMLSLCMVFCSFHSIYCYIYLFYLSMWLCGYLHSVCQLRFVRNVCICVRVCLWFAMMPRHSFVMLYIEVATTNVCCAAVMCIHVYKVVSGLYSIVIFVVIGV